MLAETLHLAVCLLDLCVRHLTMYAHPPSHLSVSPAVCWEGIHTGGSRHTRVKMLREEWCSAMARSWSSEALTDAHASLKNFCQRLMWQ